ncbi:MAG TPA: hypothetical protein VME46_03580 [Acidimicrobiales bacterium]|nr:hypothetical protein [Acidimicrobiales bacterium]
MAVLPAPERANLIALAGRQARLHADALRASLPPDPAPALEAATTTVAQLRRERADLQAGKAGHERTEAGQVARDLLGTATRLRAVEEVANHGRRWRERHAATRQLPALAEAAALAQRRWDAQVAPELARLDAETAKAEAVVAELTTAAQRHRASFQEPGRRWLEAEHTYGGLARSLDAYRRRLDGVGPQAAAQRAPQRAAALPSHPGMSQPTSGPDVGPSL